MSEFLCPKTGKQCIQAQATGEVVGDRLLEYFQMAADKVGQLGYLANLEMRIDRLTIDNVVQIHRIFDNPKNEERLLKSIADARDDTAREIMPAFIECGQDESGSGEGCSYGKDQDAQRQAVNTCLGALTTKIIENFNCEDE